MDSFLNFAQTRVISKKRLLRRIGILDDKQFAAVKRLLVAFVS
jgi:mRNA-degrading endonuclease toxin of MazEF toxin-antitoxin module